MKNVKNKRISLCIHELLNFGCFNKSIIQILMTTTRENVRNTRLTREKILLQLTGMSNNAE
jgi:hypothetical protein